MAVIQTSPDLRTQESGASSTLSFSSNVTAGSGLALWVGNFPGAISAVTDNRGNTWEQVVAGGDGGANFIEVWIVRSAAAGATTITITPATSSGNYLSGVAIEWGGGFGAPDQSGSSSTASASTAGATAQNDEITLAAIIADEGAGNCGFAAPGDATQVDAEQDSNNFTGYCAAYRVESTTGIKTATFTAAGGLSVDTVIATVRLPAAGGHTATPGAGSATITGHAPTVARTDNRTAAPGTGSATLTGHAPTALVSDNRTAEPGAGSATLTGHAPTIAVSDNQVAQPGAGSATFTGHAPTIERTDNRTAAPDAGALSLTGHAPGVTVTDNRTAAPDAGALTLTGHAPTIERSENQFAQPDAGALTITGHAPTIERTQNVQAEPGAGSLSITGHAPTVVASQGAVATPGAGEVSITGHAPTVERTENHAAEPGAGALSFTGHAPTVLTGDGRIAEPGAGEVVITGHAPTVARTENQQAEPGAGSLAFTGHAPTIVVPAAVQPGAAALSITGYAPTVRVRPIRPPKPPVNLLDPKYLGGKRKHKNIRVKGLEPEVQAEQPVQVVQAEQVPEMAPRKTAPSGLLQALLKRAGNIEPPSAPQEPPPADVKPDLTPAAPAAPYVSDLDPFYEPPPVDPAEALRAELQAELARVRELQAELQAQMQAVTERVQALERQPYVSDLDPFYTPEPEQERAVASVRDEVRRENERRAREIAARLLD